MGGVPLSSRGATPTVVIEQIDGNLTLSGWDRPELQVTGSRHEEVKVMAETETIEIRSDRNCVVLAPLQDAHLHRERRWRRDSEHDAGLHRHWRC